MLLSLPTTQGLLKIRNMMADVVVKQSKIHGRGVFAARDFKKGEVVIQWHPKILTKMEMEKLTTEEKRYVEKINEETYYLMQEPERFVNHSCEGNARIGNSCDVAVRDIKIGEEILSDYNNEGMVEFDCTCGSGHCRRRVK